MDSWLNNVSEFAFYLAWLFGLVAVSGFFTWCVFKAAGWIHDHKTP